MAIAQTFAQPLDETKYREARGLVQQLNDLLNPADENTAIPAFAKASVIDVHDQYASVDKQESYTQSCLAIDGSDAEKPDARAKTTVCVWEPNRATLTVQLDDTRKKPEHIPAEKFQDDMRTYFTNNPICRMKSLEEDTVTFACQVHSNFEFDDPKEFDDNIQGEYQQAADQFTAAASFLDSLLE